MQTPDLTKLPQAQELQQSLKQQPPTKPVTNTESIKPKEDIKIGLWMYTAERIITLIPVAAFPLILFLAAQDMYTIDKHVRVHGKMQYTFLVDEPLMKLFYPYSGQVTSENEPLQILSIVRIWNFILSMMVIFMIVAVIVRYSLLGVIRFHYSKLINRTNESDSYSYSPLMIPDIYAGSFFAILVAYAWSSHSLFKSEIYELGDESKSLCAKMADLHKQKTAINKKILNMIYPDEGFIKALVRYKSSLGSEGEYELFSKFFEPMRSTEDYSKMIFTYMLMKYYRDEAMESRRDIYQRVIKELEKLFDNRTESFDIVRFIRIPANGLLSISEDSIHNFMKDLYSFKQRNKEKLQIRPSWNVTDVVYTIVDDNTIKQRVLNEFMVISQIIDFVGLEFTNLKTATFNQLHSYYIKVILYTLIGMIAIPLVALTIVQHRKIIDNIAMQLFKIRQKVTGTDTKTQPNSPALPDKPAKPSTEPKTTDTLATNDNQKNTQLQPNEERKDKDSAKTI